MILYRVLFAPSSPNASTWEMLLLISQIASDLQSHIFITTRRSQLSHIMVESIKMSREMQKQMLV